MPEPIDAGKIFADTKMLYAKFVAQSVAAEAAVDEAAAVVFEYENDPAVANEPEMAQARILLEQCEMLLDQVLRARLTILGTVVSEMEQSLVKLKEYRAAIVLGEQGAAQVDADLAVLEKRLAVQYLPVDFGANPRDLNQEFWDQLYNTVEGPIFFFSPKECADNNLPCNGPDYLRALSLTNQLIALWEHQVDMVLDFPIIAAVDFWMGDAFESFDGIVSDFNSAIDDLWEVLEVIGEVARKTVKTGTDIIKTAGRLPGIVFLAAGIVAIVIISKRSSA